MARAGANGFSQVVVRNYRSSSIEEATQDYQRDAVSMGHHGYAPISQSWQAPSTGNAVALAGFLLIIAGWFFGLLLPPERGSETGFSAEFKVGLVVAGTVIGFLMVVLSLVFFRKPGTLTVTYRWATGSGYPPTAPPTQKTTRRVRPPLRLVFVLAVVLLGLGMAAWVWVTVSENLVSTPIGCGEVDSDSVATTEESGAASATGFLLDMQLTCGELTTTRSSGSDWRVAATHAEDSPPSIAATLDTLTINGGSRDEDLDLSSRRLSSDLNVEVPSQAVLSIEVTLNAAGGVLGLGVGPVASVIGNFNASDVVVDLARTTTPEPARIDLTFNASDGELLLPSASVVGTVELNASSLTICIPNAAEARLQLEATLASDDLADSGLTQRGEGWQTPGYGTASSAIDLDLTSTVSSLSVERLRTCN